MSWSHIVESAIGAWGAICAVTIGRKIAGALAYRAINAAIDRRRRPR